MLPKYHKRPTSTKKALVDGTIDKLERKKQIITGKTCTTDNGPEVSNVVGLERSVTQGKRLIFYYTKSYSA
jgi:hypothetical protein